MRTITLGYQMNSTEARKFLTELFAAFFDPDIAIEQVGDYVTDDYHQIADGKTLDRAGFLDHVRAVRAVTARGAVTFERVVVEGSTIATLHRAHVCKTTGPDVVIQVHAFFEIEGRKIRRVDEVTRMLSGSAEDRDLGSRAR